MALPPAMTVYVDIKSPYAYLAIGPARELAAEFGLPIDWLPYTLRIPDYLGTVEGRNDHQWRRVRYSYMDARRLANERGLTVRGPQKIFDSAIAHMGMLHARAAGRWDAFADPLFLRFWKRELDIENLDVVAALMGEAGLGGDGFRAYVAGAGPADYAATLDAAEAMGVFGVPMFVIGGEIFWGGDRIPQVRRYLRQLADGEPMTAAHHRG